VGGVCGGRGASDSLGRSPSGGASVLEVSSWTQYKLQRSESKSLQHQASSHATCCNTARHVATEYGMYTLQRSES
jgi:hypothetical protein